MNRDLSNDSPRLRGEARERRERLYRLTWARGDPKPRSDAPNWAAGPSTSWAVDVLELGRAVSAIRWRWARVLTSLAAAHRGRRRARVWKPQPLRVLDKPLAAIRRIADPIVLYIYFQSRPIGAGVEQVHSGRGPVGLWTVAGAGSNLRRRGNGLRGGLMRQAGLL